ncbi:GNAT family N-acetyltransferase [Streptacidiphilus sp. ASG 303]|uniref:GNAT family N-acetyltransferase n=1 Tax=Streptacidiphilus sp. ASG 303 TaxID=2896847 RepID=UPI001E486563|nr:GNAT family N-acetyltransferase [Streptacidiphilus sp. ASG 303]MCD0483539.1 GNAT family N-acetyltransferase [Streptacidiphilus sp. ASG 303]
MSYAIRDYTPADESSWLRCRVLSFLATAYYDDVRRAKPPIPRPGFELVAARPGGGIAAVMDVTVEGGLATIDTVAVHPDHQRRGLGRALLAEARARARARGATTLDAWTREDPDTVGWYRAMGFAESGHYLHVYANYYADPAEPDRAVGSRRPGLRPVTAFLHAPLDREGQLRGEFDRVHVCRCFSMTP